MMPKLTPCEYMMAIYHFARLFEALRLPIFNCFPLRRTWISEYATIDSKILCQNILGRPWTNSANKMNLWTEIVDMNSTALKPQELGVLRFHETIQTDDTPSLTKIRWKKKNYRRICEAIKPQEVQNAEDTLVNSRSLNLQNFEEYLRNRALVTELLQRHYTETTTNHLTMHPLHRKLKLFKYIRRQKINEDMVAKLKSKFGNDAVFVMSNYSAPNTRYQGSMRGVGFRKLLKKHGFLVYLIEEFRTSQCCPSCENQSLTIFKRMLSPRPYQRRNHPEVICYELRERLWNRDLAACLNMTHVIRNLRLNGEIPERFQRAGAERRGLIRRRRRSEENEER
ncbi:hypothetical protein G6F37_002196 [Rhizopus arrhizus]|nr:hypothetical protein G6F38_002032 [Rhizopus arrhizus]KAG1162399.1 hypothetical protein G6F37_002196 [Rhizopus arrhizus]